nr:unnamed protein product [Callosobruchus chinensis]
MNLLPFSCAFSLLYLADTPLRHGLFVKLNHPKDSWIKGKYEITNKGKVYTAFYDIPYARPPIGQNRFRNPQPVQPWCGVLDCTEPKKVCLQGIVVDNTIPVGEEDCLVLSVYSPRVPGDRARLSVVVWIHGGAFVTGSSHFVIDRIGRYDTGYFMDEDVVVVSINYRLGVLGFLTTQDSSLPANLGLKDQRLAINWVHRNIDLFGGDPEDIIIMGQDAGAVSVGYQLIGNTMDLPISGMIMYKKSSKNNPLCPWGYQRNPKNFAFKIAKKLDPKFTSSKSTDLRKLLLETSAIELSKLGISPSSGILDEHSHISQVWVPTLDKNGTYSTPQTHAIEKGIFKRVPILMGFNSEEGLSTSISGYNFHQLFLKASEWEKDPSYMIWKNLNVSKSKRKEVGQELKRFYTQNSFLFDIPAMLKYISDSAINLPVIKFAESASKHVPVYLFENAHAVMPHYPLGIEGVGHGEDMIHYWQNLVKFEPTRTKYMRMLSNFIKYKSPLPETILFEDRILFKFMELPEVRPDDISYLVLLGKTHEIRKDPRRFSLMKKVLEKYLRKPVTVF